ncbi:hyperosmotically inducible protein [Silvimonas terrae]|uniref:Hyperosmotically inducible protein n=1 Tax=Silvimonas terrae TaxID=300266 RepID=A0A840RGV9_9NEIS|nr:BON domain-containing protein [Silvimonas terrae]MBB5191758.1 hyperosmotically inducible protein [Silvimonas terrae]
MKQFCKCLFTCFAAIALLSIMGCASTSKHEATGEYFDDSVITTKVKEAIFDEPTLKVFDIKVITDKGAVKLSGLVNSRATAAKAVQVAQGISGVKSVKDEMQIK